VLQEAGKGILTNGEYWNRTINSPVAVLPIVEASTKMRDMDKPMYFVEYEDAVAVEIAYLDALRLKGEF
jgi:hypothetical protein